MDIDSLAQALFGSPRAETQEVATDGTTRTYMGVAMSDSEGGTVVVDLGGDVTLPDDLYDEDGNVVAEWDGVGVEMSTSPQVLEGEDVIVTLVGGSATKKPMVTAVAGVGDRQGEAIDEAARAAEVAWNWADDAHVAAAQAQEDAEAAALSAASAASSASDAASSASTASASAQQAVSDASTAATAVTNAQASAANAESAAQASAGSASAAATSASQAQTSAGEALTSAQAAQASAASANANATAALNSLATVEDVVDTLSWITEHGTMAKTTDTAVDPTKVYFVRDNSGDYAVGSYRYSIVQEPVASGLSDYYELTIDKSVQNYIATHLSLTSEGLWLTPTASNAYKVLVATGSGSTYTTAGTYIIDGSGATVAQFTATGISFAQNKSFYIGDSSAYIHFDGNGHISIGGSGLTIGGYIPTGGVTVNDLTTDAQSATLNSNISIGGRNLLPLSLVNSNVQSGVTASGITIVLEDDGWFRVSGSKSGNSAIGLWSDSDYTTPAVPQLDNLSGKTLTWTVETEGTPFVAGSTFDTTTHIVAYKTSSSSSTRMGGFESLVKTATVNFTHYSEIRYYIGANVPDGTTVDGRFRVMVEMGNMSTAWTPAPEDTPDQMTWYGTCSTAASTAEKAVACDGFELQTGARIAVKSTTANTANAPTLNVNGTGAIATWYNNAVSSSSNPIRWGANATLNFIYDGSVWVLDERPPSYSATCSTAAGTRAKAPSVVGALVVNGTRLSVRFSTANTYTANSVQLNLASTGAYSVYQNNAVTSTTNTLLWDANTILTFVAQGTYWHLLSRSDASKTATSYVTEITGQNGIMVHPSTDQTTGVQITSDVDILRDGTSVINIGTDDAIRIGAANNVQMLLESDGLEIDNEVGDQIFGIESSSSGSTTVTAALVTWSAVADVDTTARTVSDSTTAAGEPIVTATVNGTDYTLESTHVTATVTAGTGVTVALTSSGVSYVQDLMTEVNENSVETIFPCELSVEYQRAVTDIAELSFSGRYDLSAVGRAMILHNDQWSATNQTDIYYVAKNDVTGASVVFGVGTGGQNRGIWDEVRGNWIIHRTENNETVINGPNFSVSASGIARVTSASNASVALRASDYRNNRGIWDYDENKWLLLKGSDKKVTLYGDAIIVSTSNGRNEYSTPAGTVIWSSASGWQMADGVTLNLSKNISTCPSGIVLHWQAYANDTTQNYDHSYTFIPKQHVVVSAGAGVLCNMASASFTYVGAKYIYVHDNRLVGNANNTATGFDSSINYANNHWVLTQVIAV